MRLRTLALGLLLTATIAPLRLPAQRADDALSDSEVDQLREAAFTPDERLLLFIKFLDNRTDRIRDLVSKPRRPGREDDLHDLFTECNSILDELNDNLDDYGERHRDIRKQLPKLLQATDRWATVLRSPPDSEAYSVARNLVLEAVRDTHDEATHLVDEQRAWFAAHPPSKDPAAHEQPGPIR